MWSTIFPKEGATRPTMERRVLLESRVLGVYLHRFPRPGAIIGSHDHPWPFLTAVLRGGYHEEPCQCRSVWRGRGAIGYRRADTIHRLKVGPTGALTLCIRGPKVRDWAWMPLPPLGDKIRGRESAPE